MFGSALAGVVAIVLGVVVGKANAQAAVALVATIVTPAILLLPYAMRGFIGVRQLYQLERAKRAYFLLTDFDEIQQARVASWIGRLFNPELRALYHASCQSEVSGVTRVQPRARK